MAEGADTSLALQAVADLSFVAACAANCLGVLAVVLRFAARRLPSLTSLNESAYGMYLVHYLFVVWLQFALLDLELPAVIKGAIVFAGTLALSWGAVVALRHAPPIAQIIGRAEGAREAAAS
jgi:surface polysaccharide O-acyltransferase-like enzyme